MTLSFEVNDFKNTNSVRFEETSVDTDSTSGKDMSTKQKILTLLRNYEPMPVETIVKELGISKEIIAPELSRLKAQNKIDKFVQQDGTSKYGIKA
jgi:predicted ArsR family transcriptional regulator